MRTMKARGKDARTGEWVYGYFVMLHSAIEGNHGQVSGHKEEPNIFNDEPGQRSEGCYWHTVVPESVGQATGMYAEGVEIYEGDILRIDGFIGPVIVVYDDGAFCVATPKEYAYLQRGESPYMNDYAQMNRLSQYILTNPIAVVGNIHDHPEYLNQ